MITIACASSEEADALARELYNAERDALGCKTPERERVTKRHSPPFIHADTKALCVIVPDTKLLSPADAAKVVTVAKADEGKWTPVWEAEAVKEVTP